MNARSLQSVLVLLAQILGPFGQTWVFYKFGWVFYKFTKNGEFLNRWFLLVRGKNRDAGRDNCRFWNLWMRRIHWHEQQCFLFKVISVSGFGNLWWLDGDPRPLQGSSSVGRSFSACLSLIHFPLYRSLIFYIYCWFFWNTVEGGVWYLLSVRSIW